ncbi:MAG: hypothetical protein M3R00_06700 [Pseudomonadota bacterium]|nr:hypothetical protein [Pseudomonadota bacterium]
MQASEVENSVEELIKMGDGYRDGRTNGRSEFIKALEYYCRAGLLVNGFEQAAKSCAYLLTLHGPNEETKRIVRLRLMEVQFKLFTIDKNQVAATLAYAAELPLLACVIRECCVQNGSKVALNFPFSSELMAVCQSKYMRQEDFDGVYAHFLMACYMNTDGWTSYLSSANTSAKVQALLHIVAAKMIIEKVNPNHEHFVLSDLDGRLTTLLEKLLQSNSKEIKECAVYCKNIVLNEAEECVNVPAAITTQIAASSFPPCLLNKLKGPQLVKLAQQAEPQNIEMQPLKPGREIVLEMDPERQVALNFIALSKKVRKDTTTLRFIHMLTPRAKLVRTNIDDEDMKSKRNSI